MPDPGEILLRPIVRWPARVEPGGSYHISVDLETEGSPDAWPYPEEEYAIGCVLDGGTGFAVESAGDTTLVVHRFGGTYGPVTFVAQALDAPGDELRLTLITQGGVPFQTIPLNVDRPVPAAAEVFVAEGDSEPRRPYVLVPYPPESREVPDARSLAPSRLLAVAAQSIPFTGRADELHRLRAWLDGEGTAAMLLHGPGGQGKTRLAAAFARTSREDGRQVHAVRLAREWDSRSPAVPAGTPGGEADAPLLLVVDYAETWQIEDLLEMLADVRADGRRPVRVLFLARPAGAWWRALANRLQREGVETEAMELGPLLGDPELRLEGFHAAAAWFADLYGVRYAPDASVVSRALGTDPAFQQVLVVQMAALCAVLGKGPFTRRDRRSAVASTLLSEERAFWKRRRKKDAISVPPGSMARVVCVASLVGPLREDEAQGMLRDLGIDAPEEAVRDHARCYPPAAPGTALQPISPDRIAEDFVALVLRDDEWASAALRTLLAGPAGSTAVGMLVEVSRRWPHAAAWLDRVLRDDPGSAVEAGGAVLLRLAEMPDADPGLLAAIEERLPAEGRTDLAVAAAALAERLVPSRLAAAARDPARQAELYERLSERRTGVGMYEEAADSAAAAVAIRRVLSAAERDDAAVNRLNRALYIHSGNLGRLGRHEESLARLTESVEVLRRLAADHPEAFEAQLAASLNARALALAELGRRRESLDGVQEAVAIYARQPDADRAALASALNNLSARLAAVGRREEALEPIRRAVLIHRELEAGDPEEHRPALAANLHNHSLRLAELGRVEESTHAADEAVRIWRRLAAAVPGAYEAGLAGALANLSVRLRELGRVEEAVTANEEAIDGYRTLMEEQPDAYRPDLAAALNNYSVSLGALGRARDSLAAVGEAVASYRILAGERPDAYGPQLAAALNNQSVRLSELRDPEAGLDAIGEAVAIRRMLAANDPGAFEADLAASLANLGNRLGELGRYGEAVAAGEEAVAIYRRLAAGHPESFRPPLATCLSNLASALKGAGRRDAALETSGEAIAVYRELAAERPSVFADSLARNLNNHSVLLGALGRREEAQGFARESVEIYRNLAQERPSAFLGLFGTSLANLSNVLISVGALDDALVSAVEATQILRRSVATEDSLINTESLAAGLTNLSVCLGELGRYEEGVNAAQEAVDIYDGCVRRRPGLLPALANALMLLSVHLHAADRFDEALEQSSKAIDINRTLAEQNPSVLPSMVRMLVARVAQLDAVGRYEAAQSVLREAMRIEADLLVREGAAGDDGNRPLRELRDRPSRPYREDED
ncbi:tetratricopeptide repeat protein [Actinomadura geliboluensis]|uniref:tetratricopeptide repeat protein n=1 Tax=Actinomadura geliboluensis TaxID=882440 RepID=UPI00371ED3AF